MTLNPIPADDNRTALAAVAQLNALAQRAEGRALRQLQRLTHIAAKKHDAEDDLETRRRHLAEATRERSHREALAATSNHATHLEDLGRRGASGAMLLVASVVVLVTDYYVDRDTLLLLRLTPFLAGLLAIVVSVSQLTCAHRAGVTLRRRHGLAAPLSTLGPEPAVAGVLVVGALGSIVGIALLRGAMARSSYLAALLVAVGVTLFAGIVLLSFHHHNGLLDEARKARRRERRHEVLLRDAHDQVVKRAFQGRRCAGRLAELAKRTVAQAERIRVAACDHHAALHPGSARLLIEEPEAIRRLRPFADDQYPGWVTETVAVARARQSIPPPARPGRAA